MRQLHIKYEKARSEMKRHLIAVTACATLFMLPAAAFAHHDDAGIAIAGGIIGGIIGSTLGSPVIYASPPAVVYAPPPEVVYVPRPVVVERPYYAPYPYYYRYGGHHVRWAHHRHHHDDDDD